MTKALVISDEPGNWKTVFVKNDEAFSGHSIGDRWPGLFKAYGITEVRRLFWDGKEPKELASYANHTSWPEDTTEANYLFGLPSSFPSDVFQDLLAIAHEVS